MSTKEHQKPSTEFGKITSDQLNLILRAVEITGEGYFKTTRSQNATRRNGFLIVFVNPSLARLEGIDIPDSAIDWIPFKIRSLVTPPAKDFRIGVTTGFEKRVEYLNGYEGELQARLIRALLKGYSKAAQPTS